MDNKLNIYRLSGVDGRTTEDRARFWMADTNPLTNTRAANFLLAKANYIIALLGTEPQNEIKLLASLDLVIVSLRALSAAQMDEFRLYVASSVIQEMINTGCFVCDETDDTIRAGHLDELIDTFDALYDAEDTIRYADTEFTQWWQLNIINENYVPATEEEIQNYNRMLQGDGVGAAGDASELNDKLMESGPYFIYWFMGSDKINKYNAAIRGRYRKQEEYFQYLERQCPFTTRQALEDTLRAGFIQKYGMTPEEKIANLEKYGKGYLSNGGSVGAIDPISIAVYALIAVVVLVGILGGVIGYMIGIYGRKAEEPINREAGVATVEDFGIKEIKEDLRDDSSDTSTNTLLLLGGAAALIYLLSDSKENKN